MLASLRSQPWRYLFQEAFLFLIFTYLALVGGTFNGIILLPVVQTNLVLITALGGAWLIWRLVRKRPFPATSLEIPWLIFIGAYALATGFSTDPRRSASILLLLIFYALVFYLLVDLVRAGWTADLFIKSLIFSSCVILLFNLLQIGLWYSSWIQIAGWTQLIPPQIIRVSAFLGQGNFTAAYFNLLLPLILTRWLQSRSRVNRRIWLVWYVLAGLMLFFSLSRGGWVGSMAGRYAWIALLAFVYRDQLRKWWQAGRGRRKVFTLVGVGLILITALDLGVIFLQTNHPSHVAATSAGLPDLSVNRGYIWKIAWEMLVDHPAFGNGPFTFGSRFIENGGIPTGMILAHAHNFVFQVASETGLIGLAALGVLVGAFVRIFIRRWKNSDQDEKLFYSGIAAGLLALGVHSFFDTPEQLPLFCVLPVCLGAILAAKEEPAKKLAPSRLSSVPLILSWVLVTGSIGWYAWSYDPFYRGVAASDRQDWSSAAADLEIAAQRDSSLAFNWFQYGFARGELALAADGSIKDRNELSQALDAYQRGLSLDPAYATNWANDAELLWVSGDRVKAIEAIQKAVDGASTQPIFRLTLGRMLEEAGRTVEASQDYEQVLVLAPDWASSYFFRATPLRQKVAQAWKEKNTPAAQQSSLTEQDLFIANFMVGDGDQSIQNHLALAKLYMQHDQIQAAVEAYENAFAQIERSSSFGLGQIDTPQYGWYIYNRQSIKADLLPGINTILYSDEVVDGMLDLAGLYQQEGRNQDAISIYQKILKAVPDSEISRVRLAELTR